MYKSIVDAKRDVVVQINRGLKNEIIATMALDAAAPWHQRDEAYMRERKLLIDALVASKMIVFSGEQAEIFCNAASAYNEPLDYDLPFPKVFLQFSKPVPVYSADAGNINLACVLLLHYGKQNADIIFSWFRGVADNRWWVLADIWMNGKRHKEVEHLDDRRTVSNLANACIGYINCENIYLHKEGEVPAKVNRKREQQGKKILEPYYVCRIRGVQYDSDGEPTGQGTHHGFRYDVRGHFRRLDSGRTTWVRPHQRGLQNELYIPKTYVVEKGAKPAA